MRGILSTILVLIGLQASALTSVTLDTVLMGVSFSFTAVHAESVEATEATIAAMQEVQRIESLISSWDPNSQTSAINANAGIKPVKVDKELFLLIQRAQKVSRITSGHFDISFASIHKIWDFESFDQSQLPSQDAIKASVAMINYQNIVLDEAAQTVFLKQSGMRIGFGAIGKGYAANRVKALLMEQGIHAGVVNAGGDLLAWGHRPDGNAWSVGISDPDDAQNILAWIDVTDMAVVTSGNYKKYLEIDGKRYCHIINPKTGWPAEHLSSVTIVCPDAELADALATSVFVLGKEEGLKLINHLDGVECLIIDENKALLASENMNKNYLTHQ